MAGVGTDGNLGPTSGRRAARRRVPCPGGAAPDPLAKYAVTDLEPSRLFTWVATGPGVRTTARHLLEELGTGGTRVTLAVEQAGPVGAVMGRFYRRLTDRYLTAEAEGIKARSEGRV